MPPEPGLPIEQRLDRLLLRAAHALDESLDESSPAGVSESVHRRAKA
jgi:hypothetical protein